jgi:hypothetical protein
MSFFGRVGPGLSSTLVFGDLKELHALLDLLLQGKSSTWLRVILGTKPNAEVDKCEGSATSWKGQPWVSPSDPVASDVWFLNPYDQATHQIVFRELTPINAPLMTERDLFTGMRRLVRRSGPLPLRENQILNDSEQVR